jgi:predicted lipoprotein with Yx(FWY)xxD motif
MKRLLALFAVLLLGAGLAACGDDDDDDAVAESTTSTTAEAAEEATTTTGAPAGDEAQVAVAETSLGEVLVNGDGMTLYMFEPDTEEASACGEGCIDAWPPMLAEGGDPVAGDGADAALLGTAPRDEGDQVTYNGHRLYVFSGDSAPGDTNGQEVADVWYVLTPAGEPVES